MTPAEISQARDSRDLSSIVRSHGVRLYRMGSAWKGLCPFHRERTPSFHVNDRRGTYKCFGCGAQGDAITFLMTLHGWRFVETLRFLGGDEPAVNSYVLKVSTTHDDEDEKRRIKHAHELWLATSQLGLGPDPSPAESYLTLRGIRVDTWVVAGQVLANTEAYCTLTKEPEYALISALQDSAGHITAVQLVYLCRRYQHEALRDADGKRFKRTFGCMRDGAVRLAIQTNTLGLTGSVEDALSVMQRYSIPTWAVCGEHRLEKAWIPDDVERLMIFADADESGRRFAEQARSAHGKRDPSLHIEIVYPEQGKDFSDELNASV